MRERTESEERERAAEALRASEERLRLAQSAGGVGVWDWETATGRTYWSDQMWIIYGLQPGPDPPDDDLWQSRLHPEDQARVTSAIERFLASTETEFRYEFRIVRPDGEIRWVESIARLKRDGAGAAARMSGVNFDITARKQTEEALRASEQRYRQLADAMPQLVWTAGPDGTVDYYNSRAVEYSGIERTPAGTWSWQPILHPDDLNPTVAAWQSAVTSGQTYHCEHRIRMADGSFRWHLSRGVPMRSTQGVVKWFGTATDVHDLRMTQEALRQSEDELRRAAAELSEADRRKDEFLATLAHELRNPLSPIRNALQVMRLTGPPEPRTQWGWDVIDRQVDHLTRLIDDLLDVSRITRNKLELRKQRVRLEDVLHAAVENCRPLIDQNHHQLAVTLPPEPVMLAADQVRLIQVFMNLLNNAIKYTPPGGRIELVAARRGAEVEVSVEDTGIGIQPGELPRLFDMFYQVDQTLERSYGGLGIGLTLVQRLVEMHGGSIEARSAGPDHGSQFVVRLPALIDSPALQPETAGRSARNVSSHRILVVDDNLDSADSLALMLELGGHEVRIAHDGLEAIEAARDFRPGVVLLDLGMPKLSGYEVAQRIRQEPWGKDMMLIAQTGWGQEEDRRRTQAAGFDAHLTKPIDHAVLRELLGDLSAKG